MVDFNYNLKSIDISSATIMASAISVIFAIVVSIIILVLAGVYGGATGLTGSLTIIPSIIFCTLIITVFDMFTKSYLYNILSKRLGAIKISLFENKEVKKVSVKESSVNYTVISTIITIIYVLIAILFLPLLFSLVYQILMLSGKMVAAYMVYQIVMLFSDPLFIVSFIVLSVIIQLIICLISTYCYNMLTDKIYGVVLNLHNNEGYTVLDSVNPMNTALILSIIGLILGIVEGLINFISLNSVSGLVGSILGGFIGTFVVVFVSCYIYNILAPKLGKIKFELEEI